jgi:tRNA pseudouridine55 synthase
MDGLLVVDKPNGPTSHDVVARVRQVLGVPKLGHTGTLDPMATGVLVLVLGRATRLVRFLNADDKAYEATITLGTATDTGDAAGRPRGETYRGPLPSRATIDAALDPFRGTFLQQPPAFSAKRIAGRRSHRMARAHARAAGQSAAARTGAGDAPPLPAPARVTARAIEVTACDAGQLTLRIDCSGGFYVRSLADDLGRVLGVGAHLSALRRTRASGYGLDAAVPFADLLAPDTGRARAAAALVPLSEMLPELPRAILTPAGAVRAARGQPLGPSDLTGALPATTPSGARVCLIGPSGQLAALGERTPSGLLHPAVVLM